MDISKKNHDSFSRDPLRILEFASRLQQRFGQKYLYFKIHFTKILKKRIKKTILHLEFVRKRKKNLRIFPSHRSILHSKVGW